MKNLIKFIIIMCGAAATVAAATAIIKRRVSRTVLLDEYDGEAMFIG